MKAYFDNNGNLVVRAENATEGVALELWMAKQVSEGYLSQDIFTRLPPSMVVSLRGYNLVDSSSEGQ